MQRETMKREREKKRTLWLYNKHCIFNFSSTVPHLPGHLPDTVDELHKERGALRVCMVPISMSHSLTDRRTEKEAVRC